MNLEPHVSHELDKHRCIVQGHLHAVQSILRQLQGSPLLEKFPTSVIRLDDLRDTVKRIMEGIDTEFLEQVR